MNERMQKTKEELLQEKIAAVKQRLDRIGGEMDPDIVETVALVNLLGLPTDGSCQGHLDHGSANPWVRVTAMDEPAYKHIGEREMKESIAAAYGIAGDDVERGKNDDADEAYYTWLRDNDVPFTPEFETWRVREDDIVNRAAALVREFNAGRQDVEPLRMRGSAIVAGADERMRDTTDPEHIAERLQARRAVMAAFTEFLKRRFLEQP